jgi:hypothetical protein
VPRTGENCRRDHDDLARYGDAEVFEQHETTDRQIPVVLEDRLHVAEHPGQLALAHLCSIGSSGNAHIATATIGDSPPLGTVTVATSTA